MASHCELSSRDICYAVNRKTTTRTHSFILAMGDSYFSSYRLCVRAQGRKSTCRTFPVRQMGVYSPRWGGVVSWERFYPMQGLGPYRVTWLQGEQRLGPPLTFYVRLPSYCSPSGDVCFGINRSGGAYGLKLTLAARYFSRYRVCVRPLRKAKTCRSFRVKKTGVGAQWGSNVWWSRNFPNEPGTYRVTWLRDTSRLGPPLYFTLPLTR